MPTESEESRRRHNPGMRLWTLHPMYLDSKGLVALWREALLAQAVLIGRTRGYVNHPQLQRFRAAPNPDGAIAAYLTAVHAESVRRGYRFDGTKVAVPPADEAIETSRGQLQYEWKHLKEKLRARAPALLTEFQSVGDPIPHPLFRIVPGPIADWEITSTSRTPSGRARRGG